LELGEERRRPLTLYCRYCKSWFQSSKFDYICPHCEHDQIYVAYNCLNCGKWYFKNEPAQDYYCSNKKCEGVRLIRREKSEVEDILAKEGNVLKTFKKKSKKFSVLG
jgi:Zn finger protein HypA/HybF involved in hydrogenase expression